jgi:hypothetical protein
MTGESIGPRSPVRASLHGRGFFVFLSTPGRLRGARRERARGSRQSGGGKQGSPSTLRDSAGCPQPGSIARLGAAEQSGPDEHLPRRETPRTGMALIGHPSIEMRNRNAGPIPKVKRTDFHRESHMRHRPGDPRRSSPARDRRPPRGADPERRNRPLCIPFKASSR